MTYTSNRRLGVSSKYFVLSSAFSQQSSLLSRISFNQSSPNTTDKSNPASLHYCIEPAAVGCYSEQANDRPTSPAFPTLQQSHQFPNDITRPPPHPNPNLRPPDAGLVPSKSAINRAGPCSAGHSNGTIGLVRVAGQGQPGGRGISQQP